MLRVDDNLLHGQVAFSWVKNLRIHTIIIADDKVVNDQFMKMSLGLAKPIGVNLMIESVDDAIKYLQEESKLNILVIVGNINNAYRICNQLSIKYVNIGLIRQKNSYCIHYESMYLQEKDIEQLKIMLEKGIEIDYRLRYDDKSIDLREIINEK